MFFLCFKTQATWLRIDNDTSPMLERLRLEKNGEKKTTKRDSALSSQDPHRKSRKISILPTAALTVKKETHILLSAFHIIHNRVAQKKRRETLAPEAHLVRASSKFEGSCWHVNNHSKGLAAHIRRFRSLLLCLQTFWDLVSDFPPCRTMVHPVLLRASFFLHPRHFISSDHPRVIQASRNKIGLAPATLLLSISHTHAWLPTSSSRPSWLASETSFSRPANRPLSCPPTPVPHTSICGNVDM